MAIQGALARSKHIRACPAADTADVVATVARPPGDLLERRYPLGFEAGGQSGDAGRGRDFAAVLVHCKRSVREAREGQSFCRQPHAARQLLV
jgi:hypothetical protein